MHLDWILQDVSFVPCGYIFLLSVVYFFTFNGATVVIGLTPAGMVVN